MTREADMALIAAGSYWDVRSPDSATPITEANDAPIPPGWRVLTDYDKSNTGGWVLFSSGFSARAYQNISTSEVVISYAGTEFGKMRAGFYNDFISGNIPLGIGIYGEQAYQAALLYQRVKADLGGNISFTGHSLGGGLASVMAVWFDRPAYVFAPAPFEKSADTTQSTGLLAQYLSIGVMPTVQRKLGNTIDPAFASYDPATQYATREGNVQVWAVKGEVLEAELTQTFLRWIEGAPRTSLFAGSTTDLDPGGKHSIDLHAAALLSPNFETQAGKLLSALPLLYSNTLYGFDILGNQQVIMAKLLRNEVGVRSDAGAVLLPDNGMLTHFANDLGKLGTNIAGLNKQAQDAIIAQGIEWYYWQGTDYAGQEFFVNNEAQPGLLQYTTAQGYTKANGDHLAGAQNKAAIYAKLWLDPKALSHGAYSVPTTYEQWNVNTGTSAVTATARDADKSQIFVGNFAAETFNGGNKHDVLLASDGDDILDGGKGDDNLYGGNGEDTYAFTSADLAGWGTDTIVDSDGLGIIKVDADTLSGGKSISPLLGRAWISDDKKYQFQFKPNALNPNGTAADSSGTLVIHRTGRLPDKEAIVLNNWSQGKFGITLTTDAALPVSSSQIRVVNGDTVPVNTTVSPGTGEVTYTGTATMAAPGNSDALTVYNTSSSIKKIEIYGLEGNDALVDANGAVITLTEGQVMVSLSLDQQGDITADKIGNISASYAGTGPNSQTATSTSWALTLKDTGEADNTFNGDFLVRTEKLTGGLLCSQVARHYKFRSCLRPYLLGKSPIRCPKTTQKASHHTYTTCQREKAITPDSGAACAHIDWATGRFKSENIQKTRRNQALLHAKACV